MNQNPTPYDVAIIGGGAAGLSAALVLSRARRRVLVVDAGAPRNAPATHMHGYLSRDGLAPSTLLTTGRDEVRKYGGKIVMGARVSDIEVRRPRSFRLQLSNGPTVLARRLLVATGLRDELPDIPGLQDRWARDVLHCPYCHGWEVRDERLGVLADGSPESLRYAQIVRQWSPDVMLFVPPETLTPLQRTELDAREISFVEGSVEQVVVDADRLVGVAVSGGQAVARDVLFVPPRFVPNNDLLVRLGCELNEGGWVVNDATGRTTVSGVWVAGNVSNPRAQVITAAGEGSAAAIALNADLVDEDVQVAVNTSTQGLQS
jgi:thioredoxin reductase